MATEKFKNSNVTHTLVLPKYLRSTKSMKPLLVIAGASGVIGRHLIQLTSKDYQILTLTRQQASSDSLTWNPKAAQQKDEKNLETLAQAINGAKAIINLAGSSIADGRLDKKHQEAILESRISSTQTLIEACQHCSTPPRVFFQASAVGYYGDRDDEILDESSTSQKGNTLSDICVTWEKTAQPATTFSHLIVGRFGLVLAKDAEAWQKMILPIKLFIGGPLGSGQQWYSWMDADDVARAILFLIENPNNQGIYNFTAPQPIRQKDLAYITAKHLGRPWFVPAPAFALKILLGGVADALLLSSAKVLPKGLEQAGFKFDCSSFAEGLRKWEGD
jgi:uncharacterized protein